MLNRNQAAQEKCAHFFLGHIYIDERCVKRRTAYWENDNFVFNCLNETPLIVTSWSRASTKLFYFAHFLFFLFFCFENQCCFFTVYQRDYFIWRNHRKYFALQWHNRTPIYSNCRRYNSNSRTIMWQTIEWEFIQLIVNANFKWKNTHIQAGKKPTKTTFNHFSNWKSWNCDFVKLKF